MDEKCIRQEMNKGDQKMTKTIGEVAQEKATEYFQLYKDLKKDANKNISSKAENLALADLISEKLVLEFAIENLRAMIEANKVFEKTHKVSLRCELCGNPFIGYNANPRGANVCTLCLKEQKKGIN